MKELRQVHTIELIYTVCGAGKAERNQKQPSKFHPRTKHLMIIKLSQQRMYLCVVGEKSGHFATMICTTGLHLAELCTYIGLAVEALTSLLEAYLFAFS